MASRSFSTPQLHTSQHDGATRWAYNALLGRFNEAKDGLTPGTLWPSIGELAKSLRREKPQWWATVDWELLDNGRICLATALKRWHQCRKGKPDWHQSGSCGFPRFHRRGDRKSVSFSSHVGDGKRVKWLDQRHITLLSMGTITLAESLPEVGWVKEIHAVREGGKWYAVLVYENGRHLPDASGAGVVVGVDVGIKTLAFTSDGREYDNPRWYQCGERKLRRINKAIARSINLNPNRRTNRCARLYQQRARLQSRQQHQRQTLHRQTASAIAKSAGTVVVETLNVAGMVRNHRLAKALSALPQQNRYPTRLVASNKMLPRIGEAIAWEEASARWQNRNCWRRSETATELHPSGRKAGFWTSSSLN